jgi:hypothetical protein
MMIQLNYQKRKNNEFFRSLENVNSLYLSKTQNYIPIYSRFFSLNETNYNSINLNHKYYISSVIDKVDNDGNIYTAKVKNTENNKIKEKETFVKMAPLLDCFKYLVGKYNVSDTNLFNLPNLQSDETNTHAKLLNVNNSAYVDGFFLFLSSNLIHQNNFLHGVDYYGSFLTIKNNYKINVFDDIDYLDNSEFFKKNKNTLFMIDNYDHLFEQDYNENQKLRPIKIEYNNSAKSNISAKSIEDNIFENIFENNLIDLNDVKDMSIDLIDITHSNIEDMTKENKFTLKTNSSCSSRTSYTSKGSHEEEECQTCVPETKEDEKQKHEKEDYNKKEKDEEEEQNEEDEKEDEDEETIWEEEDDDESIEEEKLNVTIPKFPVQVIFMENCENTFDDLILSNELKEEEWLSAFMQIIMILITYQKSFSFTHNDLHTNNVMYNYTEKKYLYYCYKKTYYKVPTFGRIFKIIDFGRSIFKFNGNVFCSDSFQMGGDAATQYNTEPFFNDMKPRLEPNYSFDICRLACSIFDYIVDDISEVSDLTKLDTVKRIVVEWCLDDKGLNLLYKNNGNERYPEFKLYKMIARCVHNHTPQAQLERPEFKKFSVLKGENMKDVINIDSIPIY